MANLIAAKLHDEWPAAVAALAGAWADMAEAETLRADLGQDAAREPL
ncbi:MAG: hypothetical protein IAE79_23245 [Anaerolinea sp.]|nr:hypothetical protein [Anaerolinea sp.]